jgi:BirA family biotin operon repressor/biotin-[acetyl-CoA-carboxylase] ligase
MLKFGKQVFKLESVDSTNNYAANLINKGIAEQGAVVLADFQTKGRGQRGNSWHSAPGMNLCASFIYYPDNLALLEGITLNWWFAVSIVEALQRYGVNASVKWPNDLYVEQLKIGGILIETNNQGAFIKSAIIGVGINLNQQVFPELNATSIKLCTEKHVQLEDFLWTICDSLATNHALCTVSDSLKARYERNLFRRNESYPFVIRGRQVSATIQGVDDLGHLVLKTETEEVVLKHGEIQWVI